MSQDPVDVLKTANQGVRRLVLDNGITLLLKEDRSAPLVALQYWVGAGSIHEDEHLGGGLSHYLEHMVFKGTATRSPGQVSKEIADAGGEINAYTSNDRTVFHATLPADRWLVGLDVLTDAVFHPSFPRGRMGPRTRSHPARSRHGRGRPRPRHDPPGLGNRLPRPPLPRPRHRLARHPHHHEPATWPPTTAAITPPTT
jgi:hypothetical protein